jgi:hypothetical protein
VAYINITMQTAQNPQSLFNIPRTLAVVILLWLILVIHDVKAGQTCEERPPNAEELRHGLALAAKVQAAIDASDADVLLIARVGQDLSKYNLKHSHIAFLLRDRAATKAYETWGVFHMLNHCGKPTSGLFNEGLGMFFMDTPFRYEALIITPSRDLQTRLKTILASDSPTKFKAERYNMLAYPFNAASQNSNQWVLEILAAAMSQERAVQTREDAHAYLRYVRYKPTTLHLDTLTRLGASITKQNINFDDHPFGRRMSGKIDTVTVDSVAKFIVARDAGARLTEF